MSLFINDEITALWLMTFDLMNNGKLQPVSSSVQIFLFSHLGAALDMSSYI